jgi:aromatic-L-amino-acid/L-tryptophan decarboxylase
VTAHTSAAFVKMEKGLNGSTNVDRIANLRTRVGKQEMATLTEAEIRQLTLDPEDWEGIRKLGHRMVDDMLDHMATLRQQPAWQPLPESVRETLEQPLPMKPGAAEDVYEEFLTNVLPYTSGNRHPRSWGWVRGNGTALGMLADMLASGINAHLGGGQQAPTLVEEQVLTWLKEMMGMPATASGLLTSGGTMANLLGLAVARHAKAGFDIREEGLQGRHPRLVVYCSTETHMWARKSMEFLGLGHQSLRQIPVDENYRIRIPELAEQIAADRSAGLRPIAVLGTAGTVSTGAVDDLTGLAQLCREHGLWFHVDGAFGALLRVSPRYAPMLRGMEQADSLAFDLHKWMYLPFDIGCVLIRDAAAHTAAFSAPASYLEPAERGMLAGGMAFSDRGLELTRNFKALKVWMSLKTHGVSSFAALIEQNMEQSQHLSHAVEADRELELLAPTSMNIVCFRYRPLRNASRLPLDAETLNTLNRELVVRIQESGRYVVSGTVLGERYAIRVANTNHRSRMEDFDSLTRDVVQTGREIWREAALQARSS